LLDAHAVDAERIQLRRDTAIDLRNERVGWALVGLGPLTLSQVLRAFSRCQHSKPVALAGGNPEAMRTLARRYDIRESAIYGFDTYDRLAEDANIEIVYVVLPDALHVEYAMRAARAGKHVLCEKPATASGNYGLSRAALGAAASLRIAYRSTLERRPPDAGDDPLVFEIDCFSLCVRRIAARIAARKGRSRGSRRIRESA
jgi:hypothetical protein